MYCSGALCVKTTTRGADFEALCRRAASGVPMSIQTLIAPVRSRIAIVGSSGSEIPREKLIGITALSLRYIESMRIDEWGNEFRYRAAARSSVAGGEHQSWDVYLRDRPILP